MKILASILLAAALIAAGLTFTWAGFLILDKVPGVPLGLGMMFVGAYVAVLGPVAVSLRHT
jgi:ABC-type uncharacterized transport system permease subunit